MLRDLAVKKNGDIKRAGTAGLSLPRPFGFWRIRRGCYFPGVAREHPTNGGRRRWPSEPQIRFDDGRRL